MVIADKIDNLRSKRIKNISMEHKSLFGQYLTPKSIAQYMSRLLYDNSTSVENMKILDPGAGQGILSISLIEIVKSNNPNCKITLDAYEIDPTILPELNQNLQMAANKFCITYDLKKYNFFICIPQNSKRDINPEYTHVIMNPPYKKLSVNSSDYNLLKDVGIEITNYYAAFVSLSILLLKQDGLLVAILPRSFCNGKYFLNFRKLLLKETRILHIHSFKSRTESFHEEGVLQENIIILMKKTSTDIPYVKISMSSGRDFSHYEEFTKSISDIIDFNDPELYINIPTNKDDESIQTYTDFNDLGINISTGPIVDFRMKESLRSMPENDTVPLLYPLHLVNGSVNWPIVSKKPNAIILTSEELKKIAFPKGYYVAVKRFSSKEEKRRIWPTLITPEDLNTTFFTAENHINIFHFKKGSLNKELAIGLFVFLNTSYIDLQFRKFSGHTQVNATDLKQLKYPTMDQLNQMALLYFQNKYNNDEIFKLVVGNV